GIGDVNHAAGEGGQRSGGVSSEIIRGAGHEALAPLLDAGIGGVFRDSRIAEIGTDGALSGGAEYHSQSESGNEHEREQGRNQRHARCCWHAFPRWIRSMSHLATRIGGTSKKTQHPS